MSLEALLDESLRNIEEKFPAKEISRYSIKNLTISCNKMLDQAEKEPSGSNEMESFKALSRAVLFYLNVIVKHPSFTGSDPALISTRERAFKAMDRLDNLKRDFKARQTSQETLSQLSLNGIASPISSATAKPRKSSLLTNIPPSRVITYLSQELIKILLLDVRPMEEYCQGHVGWMRPLWKLSFDKKTALEHRVDLKAENIQVEPPWERGCVVCIDPAWLTPPVSADFILDRLRVHSLPDSPAPACFEQRTKYDIIVVYDSSSKNSTETSHLTTLLRALWDNPTIPPHQQLKQRPYVMEGGFFAYVTAIKSEQKREAELVQVGDGWGGIGLDHSVGQENQPSSLVKDVYQYIGGVRQAGPNYTINYDAQKPAIPFKRNNSLNTPPLVTKDSFNDLWGVGFGFENYQLPPAPVRPPSLVNNVPSAPPADSIESVSVPIKGPPPPIPPKPVNLTPLALTLPTSIPVVKPLLPPKRQSETVPDWSFSRLSTSSNMGMTGLKNLGNTCFLNSTVQCLSGTIPLARYFLDGSFRSSLNRSNSLGTGGRVTVAFSDLLRQMWQGGMSSISPNEFREAVNSHAPQFRGNEQHDAQEFLAFLLDAIHEDLNSARQPGTVFPPALTKQEEALEEKMTLVDQSRRSWDRYLQRNQSVVVKDFQGQLGSVVKCVLCQQTSVTFNPFMYLTVPIPGSPLKRMFSGQTITVYDCINKFLEEEKLSGSDKWHCTRCRVAREATKRLWLVKLPHILLVHLKRFYYQGPFRNKIDTFVDFPLMGLDLSPYVEGARPGEYVYDLFAVCNHEGGLNGGHYYSYVRNGYRNGQWFRFDDSRVVPMEENLVRSRGTAYILFFVRRS
jgi:ubiquitin C-terminal hydrolase